MITISNPETALMNELRAKASEYGICFRANVGKVKMFNGRYFDTGLPKGFSDLFGIRDSDGRAFFIEVKTKTGRIRPEQQKFIDRMKELNAIAGVCRNINDVEELLK